VYWTVVLLVAGGLQIALEVFVGLSLTSATGFLIRSLAALALELAAFAFVTRAVVLEQADRAHDGIEKGRPPSV
jgi:hypothetical protein